MRRNQGDKTKSRLSTIETREDEHQQLPKTSLSSQVGMTLKLAWDHANRQSVALKTFRTGPVAFEDHPCSQLVEYEIKSMDRVASHPNVVRLVDVMVRSPSNVCLVMEAAAASRGNLMETIAAAPAGRSLNPRTSVLLVHTHMQPKHLLVDPRSGNLKLSGFGHAGLWDPKAGDSTDLAHASSAALGDHAAPEMLKGSKYCGKAADCWSIGATLFTMLAGFTPFKGDKAEVGGSDPYIQPPPWICPLARSLLGGMLDPDPEKRYTLAEVRLHQWFVLKRGSISPSSISPSSSSSSSCISSRSSRNNSICSSSSTPGSRSDSTCISIILSNRNNSTNSSSARNSRSSSNSSHGSSDGGSTHLPLSLPKLTGSSEPPSSIWRLQEYP
eukprot:g9388.t1